MSEEKIQQLIKDIFAAQYNWSSSGSHYKSDTIHKDGRNQIESIIRSSILDNRDEQIGMLEAKVFTYEQIISKSNFAPMIEDKQL